MPAEPLRDCEAIDKSQESDVTASDPMLVRQSKIISKQHHFLFMACRPSVDLRRIVRFSELGLFPLHDVRELFPQQQHDFNSRILAYQRIIFDIMATLRILGGEIDVKSGRETF